MNRTSVQLENIPRLLDGPYRISEAAWMPDHIFWNRHRTLPIGHFCFSLSQENAVSRSIVNGVLREGVEPSPHLSILPAGTRLHTLKAVRHDELFFTLRRKDFERVMELHRPEPGAFPMTPHFESVLSELFENFQHIYMPGTADRIDALLGRLLDERSIAGKIPRESGGDPLVREIMSYLSANFTRELSMDEICSKFFVTRRTLYRKWRTCSAETPAEFVLKKRIRFAGDLLRTTRMGVQEIAQACGFGNSLYFTQCFRRITGSTPSAFRLHR